MKKTMVALCMLLVAVCSVQAQEADAEKQALALELMKIDLKMDVDTDLFQQISVNTYVSFSQRPSVIVMGMVVPSSYEDAKNELEKNLPPNFKVSSKGEKMMNGVNVIYLEGTAQKPDGVIDCIVYCMERDPETCTMFMGMLGEGTEKKHIDAINKAANSIIKKS